MFTFSLGLFLYVDYQIDKIDFVYNICYNSIEFNNESSLTWYFWKCIIFVSN